MSRRVYEILASGTPVISTPSSDSRLRWVSISNRRIDSTYCDFEWEMVYKKVAGVYAAGCIEQPCDVAQTTKSATAAVMKALVKRMPSVASLSRFDVYTPSTP